MDILLLDLIMNIANWKHTFFIITLVFLMMPKAENGHVNFQVLSLNNFTYYAQSVLKVFIMMSSSKRERL